MDREDELLLYVQDGLSEQDKDTFEARLKADPLLAAELAVVQAANDAFTAEDESASDLKAGWADLEQRMDATKPAAANENRPIRLGLWQVAAVAALSVSAWHFFAVPQIGDNPARYETVSAESSGLVMQVVFRPDATFAEAATFLTRFDGSISDGPGATGVYRVQFDDPSQLELALTSAKAESDLFAFVAAE